MRIYLFGMRNCNKDKKSKRGIIIKIIGAAVIAAALIAGWTLFFACQPPIDRLGHLVTELRDNIFVGESSSFSVQAISGRREDPFLMDGNVGTTRDFTLFTLTPKGESSDNLMAQTEYSVKVLMDGTSREGMFVPHPFSNTLSVEFDVRAINPEITVTILRAKEVVDSFNIYSVVSEQMIGYERALEIAEKKLRNSIEVFKVNGELNCEIYIRLIENQVDGSGGHHWYVAFVGSNQTIFAVLIDSISMEVVAIRN